MGAVHDDMLGKFAKTSEAYLGGLKDGRVKMHGALRAVVEQMAWAREGKPDKREEFVLIKDILGAIDREKPV